MEIHLSESRGKANLGWLKSHHTFSFASYYNPKRMGFGTLRVINDDIIDPAMGFGTHPHKDMEIISVPIYGALRHEDNMGNVAVIKKGEIQAMSAGTGVTHSEFNNSSFEDANFLQIWVLPEKKGTKPSYSQKFFSKEDRRGKFQLIVSPDGRDNSVQIGQKAFFSMIDVPMGEKISYQKYVPENGVYFFVIEGRVNVGNHELKGRDGLGLELENDILLSAQVNSEILIMEVPMTVSW